MNLKGMIFMRRFFGFVAGALLCLAVSAPVIAAADPGGSSPADRAAMEAARERVAAGDLDGAVKQLSAYVKAHPDESGPERLLGDLYFRHGDLTQAQAAYQHILQYAPNDKDTHSRLGSVYATENKVDEAIQEFNRSLPGTDSVPNLVALHLRKGDFAQYKRDREQMVHDYPGDDEAVLELAQLYETINQPDLAMQYFQRVLDIEPRQLFALNGLGLSLEDKHADREALTEFNLCVLYDSFNYECWTNMGGTYWDMHDDTNAMKVLTVARNLEPERPEALVNMGNVYDDGGDWKKAVAFYAQAMTVDPYQPEAYIDLGTTYDDHGLYQLAQAALIKGLAVAPQDGRLHFVLGETYRRMGQTAQAQDQYRDAEAQDIWPTFRELARQGLATLGQGAVPTLKP